MHFSLWSWHQNSLLLLLVQARLSPIYIKLWMIVSWIELLQMLVRFSIWFSIHYKSFYDEYNQGSYNLLSSNLTERIGIHLDPALQVWTDNAKITELAHNTANSQMTLKEVCSHYLALIVPLMTLMHFVSLVQSSGSFTSTSAQVVQYPPTSSNLNDLNFVLNGAGAPGIFDSSITPEKEYGIYNWCNMPHVRTQEYMCVYFNIFQYYRENNCWNFFFLVFHIRVPHKSYTLQYVEVIHRHHKRTPYSSNMFFKEDIEWSCVGEGPVYAVTRWEKLL